MSDRFKKAYETIANKSNVALFTFLEMNILLVENV